jgi:hypothetical protein
MTRYAPLWQQAGSYAATLDRSLLAALWPSGGATGGVVTASATTMQVTAAPGTVAVPLQSGQGVALCRWDANEVPTLAAAPPSGQSRIDLVIVQVRDNALDAGANNDFIITNVTGVPAASAPATPATPTNAAVLAQVLVPGAVANLSTATVADRRGYPLNPAVTPYLSVYLSTAQVFGAGVFSMVPYDQVETGVGWAPNTFTVTTPGLYLVTATHVFNGNITMTASVYKNTTEYKRGTTPNPSSNPSGQVTAFVPTVAGDKLAIGVFANVSATSNPGSAYCWAQFRWMGP